MYRNMKNIMMKFSTRKTLIVKLVILLNQQEVNIVEFVMYV